jgi:DNA-binding MarR family transcriptional regulator
MLAIVAYLQLLQEMRAHVIPVNDSDARAVDAALTASRALMGVVARSVAGVLEIVTLPQFRVLVVLDNSGPLRMGVLGEAIGVLPSTLSRAIDRIVEAGWVRRTTRPTSRREVLIELTPAGQNLVTHALEQRRDNIVEILSVLSPDEKAAIVSAFELFAGAAGETSSEDLLILGI